MNDGGDRDSREWELERPSASVLGDPGDLLRDAYLANPHDLPQVFARHAEALGCRDVTLYLADLQQTNLMPFAGPHGPSRRRHPEPLPVDSTLAGRCYQHQRPVVHVEDGDALKLWMPLQRGSERIGVGSFTTTRSNLDDADLVRRLTGLVAVIAHLILAKAPYSDALINVRRQGQMGLSAEMQWALLPPLTFVSEEVAVSGVLEPAYDVAGDSVDYAIENGACSSPSSTAWDTVC